MLNVNNAGIDGELESEICHGNSVFSLHVSFSYTNLKYLFLVNSICMHAGLPYRYTRTILLFTHMLRKIGKLWFTNIKLKN